MYDLVWHPGSGHLQCLGWGVVLRPRREPSYPSAALFCVSDIIMRPRALVFDAIRPCIILRRVETVITGSAFSFGMFTLFIERCLCSQLTDKVVRIQRSYDAALGIPLWNTAMTGRINGNMSVKVNDIVTKKSVSLDGAHEKKKKTKTKTKTKKRRKEDGATRHFDVRLSSQKLSPRQHKMSNPFP